MTALVLVLLVGVIAGLAWHISRLLHALDRAQRTADELRQDYAAQIRQSGRMAKAAIGMTTEVRR